MASRSLLRRCGRVLHSRLLLLLAIPALLLGNVTPTLAATLKPENFRVQVRGGFMMSEAERAANTAQLTPEGVFQWCVSRGGVPAADGQSETQQLMVDKCKDLGVGMRCSALMDGSAKQDPDGRRYTCIENTRGDALQSSRWCTYRFRYGFYDAFVESRGRNSMIQEDGYTNPGLSFFKCLYLNCNLDANDQFANGFTQSGLWNTSVLSNVHPNGKFQILGGIGVDSSVNNPRYIYYRMDTAVPMIDRNPNPLTDVRAFCYYQGYVLPLERTTRAPQPAVVRGYPELSWVQEHWYVIYGILAAVLLTVVIGIIIYCAITSRKEEEKEPITSMVYRERVGRAYVQVDDDSGAPTKRSMPFPMPMPVPVMIDPEDMMQGVPQIFSQDDGMLRAESSSFAEDDDSDDMQSAD